MSDSHISIPTPDSGHRSTSNMRLRWGVPLIAGLLILVALIAARAWHGAAKANTGAVSAAPAVAVVKVERHDLYKEITIPALRHRLIRRPEAEIQGITEVSAVERAVGRVAVPR